MRRASTAPEGTWSPLCRSSALGARPLAATLQGQPLVLFRDPDGHPATLEDRCPHRQVPLSTGSCRDGLLECGYHGWRFDRDGDCLHAPGALPGLQSSGRCLALPSWEQQGLIWVWGEPARAPSLRPPRFRSLEGERAPFSWTELLIARSLSELLHAVDARCSLGRTPPHRGSWRSEVHPESLPEQDSHSERQRASRELTASAPAGEPLSLSLALCPEASERTRIFLHLSSAAALPPASVRSLAEEVFGPAFALRLPAGG